MKRKQSLHMAGFLLALSAGVLSSCEKNVKEPAQITDADATTARATYSSRSVNWDNRADGTYSLNEASGDFGNVSGWNESRAYNSSGTCRITLLKNALSGNGGVIANIDVPDGSEYEVQFSTRFHSAFDWSRGGKIGFGFRIGEGNTGCDRADDGNGGSARMMWYNNGEPYLRPYLYYRDMPSTCGHDFGKRYPSSGSLQRGTWYTVRMRVKSNTGSSTNGSVLVTVNGTTVLSTSIRWTTNDAQRLIKTLAFHTFRGGSDAVWESSTDGYIYYDNLSWTRIAS
jgi:hypothetical protein